MTLFGNRDIAEAISSDEVVLEYDWYPYKKGTLGHIQGREDEGGDVGCGAMPETTKARGGPGQAPPSGQWEEPAYAP